MKTVSCIDGSNKEGSQKTGGANDGRVLLLGLSGRDQSGTIFNHSQSIPSTSFDLSLQSKYSEDPTSSKYLTYHGRVKGLSTDRKKESFKQIEVAPGQFMRLRGADETYEAIKSDNFVPTMCYVCTETVCCIDSAHYVLCPVCRVVSPVNDDCYNAQSPSVGLGFTLLQLSTFLNEISGQDVSQMKTEHGSSG